MRTRPQSTQQTHLDIPGTPTPKPLIAVRVNEALALTYTAREAANWWALYRAHGPEKRFVIVTAGFIGDTVDVLCDDQAHAEWLRDDLIERGIPETALKIVRPTT